MYKVSYCNNSANFEENYSENASSFLQFLKSGFLLENSMKGTHLLKYKLGKHNRNRKILANTVVVHLRPPIAIEK